MATPPLADLDRSAHAPAQRRPRGAVAAVAGAAVATILGASLLARGLGDDAVVWRGVALALGGGTLLSWLAARHLALPRFGMANAVTLTRAVLVLLLLALLGAQATSALAWLLVALSLAAAVLDGVDGALARSRAETSAFGARFDMEIDALLILVLAALVWQHGKAGPWILLAGLLRYLFVAASYALPWLAAALPPSRRRQTVCVVQIATLIAALVPLIVPPWSAVVAVAGLAALVGSFGIDVVWLQRHARA
ncbi:MAG TPA: CDP-alcohol phosphatidyltransferase family protein [Gammaproteobacteria bacterium]|nr:CDP-alcohol phosphatidyltransferase family protein [Gammaproteobacteria bacterium]